MQYLPLQMTKALVRDSWNATPSSDMSEFLAWVLVNLRARGQRVSKITSRRKCLGAMRQSCCSASQLIFDGLMNVSIASKWHKSHVTPVIDGVREGETLQ